MSRMFARRGADPQALIAAIDRSMAIIEFDLDGTILSANDNFLKAMGYEAGEIVGQHHRIFVPPEEARSQAYAAFWRKMQQGQFDRGRYKRLGKGGREIWIEASYNPVMEGGRPVRVVKFATDITAEHLAALDAKGRMQALDRSQAIIEFTPDGRVLAANGNFLDLMGYSLAEIRGQHHAMFCFAEDRDTPAYREFWNSLQRGEYSSGEFRRQGKDGKEVHIRGTYNPIVDADGRVLKVVKLASDVTEQVSVKILAEGLHRLAAGELSHRIATPFQPALEQIRKDFNLTAQKLDRAIQAVSGNAEAIASAATEIRSANEDLARRTEQQAASVEETSASVTEVSAAVSVTARAAQDAGEASQEANRQVEQVHALLDRTRDAMEEIETSTQEIAKIVSLIDRIAMQTNLLALNAGVEAARAGEAGRGFAVVAQEVRELSKQTKAAASDVKDLIAKSVRQVATGSQLVGEAGTSFGIALQRVVRVTEQMEQIAVAAAEQSAALGEISQAVAMIDKGTQLNAAMVEETTVASASLADEARMLFELIGKFAITKPTIAPEERREARGQRHLGRL